MGKDQTLLYRSIARVFIQLGVPLRRNQLDFYEFVTDTYTTFHLEHNFNGRLLARVPLIRKLNLRAIVGFRSAWGQLSDENILLNSTNNPAQITLLAPTENPYYEYSAY